MTVMTPHDYSQCVQQYSVLTIVTSVIYNSKMFGPVGPKDAYVTCSSSLVTLAPLMVETGSSLRMLAKPLADEADPALKQTCMRLIQTCRDLIVSGGVNSSN